jgi:ADP-L-glycero-D-manno-heptose 6-epimerase
MYLVTGGAGFIGSNLVAALSARGDEVAVCDWMRTDERWRNLAGHELAALIRPDQLRDWLPGHAGKIKAVLHMGAISTTTETDIEALADQNIRATLELLLWCTQTETRLIYASSAATYGDGSAGFDDDSSPAALAKLRPLNAYGWSKHVVDRRIARLSVTGAPRPPQCVGLKFFNVYGPNEYHKGAMKSVVAQNFTRVRAGEPLRLFRSYRPDYADGGQLRDFIYVPDCVDVVLWLIDHPAVSGLFNVGTGKARSWLDLANAVFAALGREPHIEFIGMPPQLIENYQYFTEAKMDRLSAAGYSKGFTELEAGIGDYVRSFLGTSNPYR